MAALFSVDGALNTHREAIARHEDSIATFARLEESSRQQLTELDLQINSLEAQIKELTKRKRIAQGEAKSAVSSALYMRRLIMGREAAIKKREKDLIFQEGQKRLRTIGRDLKRNVGRRGGGGLDIVDTGAPVVKPATGTRVKTEQQEL